MVKYNPYKVCGHILYFTSKCVVEAMHVHVSADEKLSKSGSAKFWVHEDGSVTVAKKGMLTSREIKEIEEYIKEHYKEMYETWSGIASTGFKHKK